jgi:hypothetical protein
MYHPSSVQSDGLVPFASPVTHHSISLASPLSTSTFSATSARLFRIEGSIVNHKVILNWVVGENETADQFEIEKSTDGKNYILAALVFGTDKMEGDNYQFYEKAGNQKVSYRIKLINKNHKTEYSPVVEINPNA